MMSQNLWLRGLGAVGLVILVSRPAWAQVAQVTGIKVNPTSDGVEIFLTTDGGTLSPAAPSISGNTFVIELSNAKLQLPEGQFRQVNPVSGIAAVTVIPVNETTIRVEVTGSTNAPSVKVGQSGQGVTLSVLVDEEEEEITVVGNRRPTLRS